jgi:hypothetical protein
VSLLLFSTTLERVLRRYADNMSGCVVRKEPKDANISSGYCPCNINAYLLTLLNN